MMHSTTKWMPRRAFPVLAVLALLAGLSLTVERAQARQILPANYTYTVNSPTDAHDANLADNKCIAAAPAAGKCTLRAAIEQANADGSYTHPVTVNIVVPAGTYNLSIAYGELLLGYNLPGYSSRNIIHIYGSDPHMTKVVGNGEDRVFSNSTSATIQDISITNGFVAYFDNYPVGGGVFNQGTLSLYDVIIKDNHADCGGGGVFNGYGPFVSCGINQNPPNSVKTQHGTSPSLPLPSFTPTVSINSSTISENTAGVDTATETIPADGGGILNQVYNEFNVLCIGECPPTTNQTTLQLGGDLISENTASRDGGGVYNAGGAQIHDTSVIGNHAFGVMMATGLCSGGGIYNAAGSHLSFQHGSITDNTTIGEGGGFFNQNTGDNPLLAGAQATLDHTTMLRNTATNTGGGIRNDGRLTINLSTIRLNVAGVNTAGLKQGIPGFGGGIYSTDHLMIINSTIDANQAIGPDVGNNGGGGIFSVNQTWLTNATITNNSALNGAGILYDTTTIQLPFDTQEILQMQGVTIKSNQATFDGGGLLFFTPLTNGVGYPAQGRANDTQITGNSAGSIGGGVYQNFPNDLVFSGMSAVSGNTAPICPQIAVTSITSCDTYP